MVIALGVRSPLIDPTKMCTLDNRRVVPTTRVRLPPRLLSQCLREIFSYLFNVCPTVVVMEYAHFADYSSWTVLVNLVNISSLSLVVITMEPLEDLAIVPDHFLIPTPAADVPIVLARLITVRKKLLNSKGTIHVTMGDYSILDVDQLLCSVLGVAICPEGVANMVHQLSGGNPFWCREMVTFIRTTGADEFLRAMNLPDSPRQDTGRCNRETSESQVLPTSKRITGISGINR